MRNMKANGVSKFFFKNGISDPRYIFWQIAITRCTLFYVLQLFLDYNLQVSPRLKDSMAEGDRSVSNFVMSQDTGLHLSDFLALYLEKRDTFHTHCQCPKKEHHH